METKKLLVRVCIIAVAFIGITFVFFTYSYPILNSPPTPQSTYNFIKNNFNTTINSSTQLQVIEINTTFEVNGTSYSWLQGKHIYYMGAEFCPYCASYSYVLSEAFNGNIPPLNSSFYISEGQIPAIPISAIENMKIPDNFTLIVSENPLTTTDLSSYPPQELSNMTESWLAQQPSIMKVIASGGTIPEVYIANTIGNETYICNGYVGLPISIYNQTTASQYSEYNMVGIPYNSYLPSPYGLNLNYNMLEGCINKMNSEG